MQIGFNDSDADTRRQRERRDPEDADRRPTVGPKAGEQSEPSDRFSILWQRLNHIDSYQLRVIHENRCLRIGLKLNIC
ncbi:unnamed protein product [Oppiella nova]|uniref:Uncharacterized protein n=1 Tax=Oppiella nova TaxID=334625 RepID=A0A7R9MCB2_9ACAR|nr:unnamed protein product [Oppiella nova]CAG2174770.1 unnamed protein product [Oppiella nova]